MENQTQNSNTSQTQSSSLILIFFLSLVFFPGEGLKIAVGRVKVLDSQHEITTVFSTWNMGAGGVITGGKVLAGEQSLFAARSQSLSYIF